MRIRVVVLLLPLVTLLALAACTKQVDKDQLEDQVLSAVTKQAPQYKSVKCEDDLKAEEQAKTQCTLIAGDGSHVEATVVVTEVDGNDVRFDVAVDNQAKQ